MPEILQSHPTAQKPTRRKKNKETHNAVERHRKEKINAGIKRIGDLLPCSQALKQSKNMILGEAFRYITELKQQNDEMLLNGGDKVQAEEIKRLRQQLEDLRKESAHYIELLKANGINFLDDPTIHWKGKQRCAKVAKVTPTHLMSKGIIVYSNGNSSSSTGKISVPSNTVPHLDKQPVNAITIHPSCNVQMGTGQTLAIPNGTQINEMVATSATSSNIPLATLIPAVSKPCLAVVEQYTTVAPVAPKLSPPVNYITVQGLCPKIAVTAPTPQHSQPANPTPSLASSTSPTMPLRLQPVISLSSLPHTVIGNTLVSDASSVFSQDTEIRSLAHTLPTSSTHLRTCAASSTQTTWTTLQLTGNTVQPVCQALTTEANSSGQHIQQLSVCPIVANPPMQPTPFQQPQVPIQLQTPAPAHIPVQPRPPQLYSAVVPHPQTAVATQTSLLSQTAVVSQSTVLHQPSVVPQKALLPQPQAAAVAQPTILPKPAPPSSQSHSYPAIQPKPQLHNLLPPQPDSQPSMPSQPQPQPAVIPQAQAAIVPPLQHAVVPQPQAATLPVLQTMQVLQMNSDGTPVVGTSPSQNNQNVVILQQPSPCPAPQVIRDDVTNQAPCQHIVIIQTPTMTPAPQNHQTNIVPNTTPVLPNQMNTSSSPCTPAVQANVMKQLVHILPRPTAQVQTPQTITVNGQVYVLQSVKSADKGSSQVGQSATTQIIQPTSEESSTNVAFNCLGALNSLSQSISQVSSQSNLQLHTVAPPSYTTVQPSLTKPVSVVSSSAETVLTPVVPVPETSTSVSCAVNIRSKKSSVASVNVPKQTLARRPRSARRKEPKQRRSMCRIASKPVCNKVPEANVTKGLSTSTTEINLINSSREDISHKTSTQTTPMAFSVTSSCNNSTAVCVSSSTRPTNSSVCSSENGSTVTSLVDGVEVVKSTGKFTELTVPSNSITICTVNSAVSSTKNNLEVHTNSGSVLTPGSSDFHPTESTVSVLSSQCSSMDTCVTSFTRSVMSDISMSSAAIEVNSQKSTVSNCSTTCRPTEPRPGLTSPTENALVVSSVDSSLCQPSSIHTCSSIGATKSVLTVSLLQNIPQVQAKPASERDCKSVNSPQVQTPFTLPSASPSCSDPATSIPSDSTPPVLPQESRNSNTFNKSLKQPEINISMAPTSHVHSLNMKLTESNERKEPVSGEHSSEIPENVTESDSFSHKETVLSQEVSTLENESFESALVTNRQTDSPMAGGSGSRGFSVASLLPTGHNITSSSSTYGAFSFTSEQAEILAMAARAIFEQDSPGRRNGSCSGDSSSNTTATGWDLPKTLQVPSIKERVTSQQLKQAKHADLTLSKTPSHVSIRGPPIPTEVSGSGTTGTRLPMSTAYSQSQSSTLSLNVNNLIRPSSIQPYPGSPNLGQQVSIPSPGGVAIPVSQSSSQVTPSCSGPGQGNEYTLKNALMRTHLGAGIAERHQKDIPKRSAQEELVLPINKRSKPCPGGSVARIDVKGTEHVQVMPGQMPPSSSTVMTRNHSDGAGALFSGNTFMNTVLRPSEGHCPTQLATHEQNQASVVHLQQGHSQHSTPQSGQNLGGNLYLKHQQQQQQQEQQRHLYQLQHHLTQPDTQIHNIQQRALLQDQIVHKKRIVRGGQTGPPVGLQKQHHLEKNGVQPQHQQQQQHQPQQQSQQHQQQAQQQQQQSQQHQQQAQQQQQQQQSQQHPQHQQQAQQHQQQKPQLTQQQQPHQQQIQQQGSHSRHQHLQQQIQQQHFASRQEKNCDGPQPGPRAHQSSHLGQQDRQPGQDHGVMQRLMGSRTLEQLTSQANNSVSRSSDLACTPSRQERHRLSSYSAEALIGKTSTAGDQRMGLHLQVSRGNSQDQSELQGYVDSSRGKGNIAHNPQTRLTQEHPGAADIQRVSECLPFKTVSGHQLNNFEVSRSGDMSSKSVAPVQRGPQPQAGFRIGAGPAGDGRSRGTYGTHPSAQGVQTGTGLSREQDACHQSFMQSLLAPQLPEQSGHQRATQGCPPSEYNCVPGVSSGELQAKVSSPNLHPPQTAPPMHLGDNNKGHISQVSGNLHGSSVRSVLPHPPSTPHSSSDTGRAQGSTRSLSAVSQRAHHIGPDPQSTKIRPGDRARSGNLRPVNTFEPEGSLTIPSGGGVLLGRSQAGGENRRKSIVRFMSDGAQVSSDNNLVSDQHLTQNFGFPFIAEGGMNPPPPINANASFIPPVTQPSASRTPALLPVEPQNTLPSFYPSYSPAAHPSLPSEIPLQYFSNQMFTSPSADKSSTAPLNNRFGSILSPPRPVGFAQASYPLLTDITPMPIANSSGITPHLSNFNLTSLFPEIATAMPPDGSSMPMSPLLSLANTSSSDSNKQSNRPAHNISHILGHDGTSAI